jgi:malate dehydrogenase (oxaloacetate-decarboxylating)(NADP+)
VATGRSDYPNQVNNVLCFPFIFRGALDVGATEINEAMKIACAEALAKLARVDVPDTVAAAYGLESLNFGPDYIIPKPLDPRLAVELPIAVARAAMESGVAGRPIEDAGAYRQRLNQFVFRSGLLMRPIFERARAEPKRLVYTDGEEERVLRAVQVVVDEGLARPILIGRPDVVRRRIERLGLRLRPGVEFELVNPEDDPRYNDYVAHYRRRMGRRGVTPATAREAVRTRPTVIAAIMVDRGEADAMIAGPVGVFEDHLRDVVGVFGLRPDVHDASTLHVLLLERGPLFMADTYVSFDPPAEEVCETTLLAAEAVRRFGIEPKVALLSHSNFGSAGSVTARKMRAALALIRERAPELEADGEMHGDAALVEAIRERILPDSRLRGAANLLILPTLDAANIAFNLLKAVTGVVSVGPILIGPAKPGHVVTASISSRGIVNMSALAAVGAQDERAATAPSLAG